MLKVRVIFSYSLALVCILAMTPSFANEQHSVQKQSRNSTKILLLNGFKRYHSVCSHCHGPDGLGSSFAPSLVTSPFEPEFFAEIVKDGSNGPNGTMAGYANNSDIMNNLDAIYAYINARNKGHLGRGRPQ